MALSARSLILDLLSTVRRGTCPVRALVEAATLFRIAENSVRVALARLRAEGLVEADRRGSYRLGTQARALQDRIRGWRAMERSLRPWRGAWLGVHTGALPRSDRAALESRTRALRLLGFRTLSPGLELRPDNLVGGVAAVCEPLHELGLEATAPVFVLARLDAANEARARGLWEVDALREGYRETRRLLEASARRLPRLDRAAARVESFELGRAAIRQMVLDPRLPEPILAGGERRDLIETLGNYDELGRACWAGWLRGAGEARTRPSLRRRAARGSSARRRAQEVG